MDRKKTTEARASTAMIFIVFSERLSQYTADCRFAPTLGPPFEGETAGIPNPRAIDGGVSAGGAIDALTSKARFCDPAKDVSLCIGGPAFATPEVGEHIGASAETISASS
jgi:hypothetical protein